MKFDVINYRLYVNCNDFKVYRKFIVTHPTFCIEFHLLGDVIELAESDFLPQIDRDALRLWYLKRTRTSGYNTSKVVYKLVGQDA